MPERVRWMHRYDAWLTNVCEKGGLIVVATPYELDTDHRRIATEAARLRDRAIRAVRRLPL